MESYGIDAENRVDIAKNAVCHHFFTASKPEEFALLRLAADELFQRKFLVIVHPRTESDFDFCLSFYWSLVYRDRPRIDCVVMYENDDMTRPTIRYICEDADQVAWPVEYSGGSPAINFKPIKLGEYSVPSLCVIVRESSDTHNMFDLFAHAD